jgi:hypothetical protein
MSACAAVEQRGNFEVDEFALFPANALRDGVCESFQIARGSIPFWLEVVRNSRLEVIAAFSYRIPLLLF